MIKRNKRDSFSYRLKRFLALSAEEKGYFLEAYFTLGVMRGVILTRPFKQITKTLEQCPASAQAPAVSEEQLATARKIGAMIETAAAHTPWESACLAKALTAWKMLQRRGIPGGFYLGAFQDQNAEETMQAHAWSQCGKNILTGAAGHEKFAVLSLFRWPAEKSRI
ncbi:lasso peptide biosynthesis B2 protein [Nitratifractor sp.]|uniref:lasso peptide biosynthesis B2 protein n=1 Tax=Nitratifractor sp. TaxID=2268144 RepID=UPI0025E0C2D2|nr:lasso peptide biosynthesis B2 protein [Nitratifractor sp.]